VSNLFSDFAFQTPRCESSTASDLGDVLVTSNGNCGGAVKHFKGKVLHLDGENGEIPYQPELKPKLFYLGISTPPLQWTVPVTVKGSMGMNYMLLEMVIQKGTPSGNELAVLDRSSSGVLPFKSRTSQPSKFLAYMQSNCKKHREFFFDAVVAAARAARVADPVALGKCHGTHPELSQWKQDRKNRLVNAIDKLKDYRFVVAMENSNVPGYITEKIMQAFTANAVPVYWGDVGIKDIFDQGAFVYVPENETDEAVQRIIAAELDEEVYAAMLSRPIVRDPVGETLKNVFSVLDSVGGGVKKKKIREMMGIEDGWRSEDVAVPPVSVE